ncbi:hypothetical protein C4565_10490 [Candidatus Parcubacteria bacterium]|nr:MAG: hypothetical protein C4565_10490 [Candidatus Parcubacteria bacterium]
MFKHTCPGNWNKFLLFLIGFSLLTISINACQENNMTTGDLSLPKIKNIPPVKWTKLAEQKIYFGHQSVGVNILEGMQSVIIEYPQINLKIMEITQATSAQEGVFAHSTVGQNEDPFSKIDAFTNYINSRQGKRWDIAFFKFCYIDINAATDINKLFVSYKNALNEVASKHPTTTFIHFTVPLTVVQKGPKALAKKILGKSIGGYIENIKRNQFNRLLIDEFKPNNTLFDLAQFEATRQDGSLETFEYDGNQYLALTPGYAFEKDLGRHLNETGSKFIAEQLLIFLANL